ncbi:uncharacterized protein N7498_007198 [Penicillium cinerascens]|uniref:DJ-1/PfpI domain-containing protein n=1 Tax=Penicillium cinerascens TaxID=70096 RepID=A0A9W9JL45_9EURO|nr:uncharacterized protein N7498_007198 [Penicillium cinerascens]KAJ5198081.1 hypothetical protein N7498_007198 [Penicillium cinerascens]
MSNYLFLQIIAPVEMAAPLRVGVLLVDTVQLLDLAAVDLIFMTSPDYVEDIGMPKVLQDLGRPCEIHYIGRDGANAQSPVTSQMSLRLTDSLTDTAVAPGNLDILYLPGPPPKAMPPHMEYLDFVRKHNAAATTIMTVCTGILIAAHAGITEGKTATAPRFLIPLLRKQFPETKLWDDSVRATCDGNLWTGGGVTNGHDLVAAYLRAKYPAPLVNTVLAVADVTPRPVRYQTAALTDTIYVLFQIIRAIPSSIVQLFRNK